MENTNSDKNFTAFITNVQHDARMENTESKNDNAKRLLDEISEVLDTGIQSREEGTALLAKLDIVIESVDDFTLKAAAQNFKTDIQSRYAGVAE